MAHEPVLDVECPICLSPVGEPCDQPLHTSSDDAAGDPGTFGVLDLDGDGVIGALDPDDPGFGSELVMPYTGKRP